MRKDGWGIIIIGISLLTEQETETQCSIHNYSKEVVNILLLTFVFHTCRNSLNCIFKIDGERLNAAILVSSNNSPGKDTTKRNGLNCK